MAASWQTGDTAERTRHVTYPTAMAVAVAVAVLVEVVVRFALDGWAPAWTAARLPFVGAFTLVGAQIPRQRERTARSVRPRSELRRYLDRRSR